MGAIKRTIMEMMKKEGSWPDPSKSTKTASDIVKMLDDTEKDGGVSEYIGGGVGGFFGGPIGKHVGIAVPRVGKFLIKSVTGQAKEKVKELGESVKEEIPGAKYLSEKANKLLSKLPKRKRKPKLPEKAKDRLKRYGREAKGLVGRQVAGVLMEEAGKGMRAGIERATRENMEERRALEPD